MAPAPREGTWFEEALRRRVARTRVRKLPEETYSCSSMTTPRPTPTGSSICWRLTRTSKRWRSAGAPLPNYESARPPWFPANFDWVFGCAYEGMPTELGPLAHLIGANMSVRRDAFERIGGFHSIDFDDLDLCMRLAAHFPDRRLLYEPRAIVHHYVPAQRVEWRYFWRRCFFVNREKVEAFADMGDAANIQAELEFVRRAFTRELRRKPWRGGVWRDRGPVPAGGDDHRNCNGGLRPPAGRIQMMFYPVRGRGTT